MKTSIDIKLLKSTVKVVFKKLRSQQKINSKALGQEVFITRDIWEHLLFAKNRDPKEVVERLCALITVESVLNDRTLVKVREEKNQKYYRIEHKIDSFTFGVIVLEKTSKKSILFSCFKVFENTKKRPV